MQKKIYLAGPDVFLSNARDILGQKADMVRAAGFIPLCPGDLEVPPSDTKKGLGLAISAINEGMMRDADAVIANLTPFRGVAADVGTSFELGFMCALGKVVYGYTNVETDHFKRCADFYGGALTRSPDGRIRGPDGLSIEDFDMVDNLMLDGGIESRGGIFVVGNASEDALYTDMQAFAECLRLMASRYAS
ncbi:nucleoside 2-deoxyribosyltransferase [Pararhizobium antarcticum]|uniref:Nucleoside 2-deoxyribosyltransferase n=1 Tax=Pararhizobium antarcticum TaxID=1798805 RepID=A0A657LP09_9HYPH|nr:nucleoside 2-deoxyribosyltransferase [Pararhizobium antarcticum]OJF93444.1 nucleoside 2-deoxyribosyltransferase [Pararhizobium antarcticum]OJG00453.1 nucleoside 2-deoxyribosyltransferase [Rhizobium sp. 58]